MKAMLGPRRKSAAPPPILRRIARLRDFASRLRARHERSGVQRRRFDLQLLRSPFWQVVQVLRHHEWNLRFEATHLTRQTTQLAPPTATWRERIARVLLPHSAPAPRINTLRRVLTEHERSARTFVEKHLRIDGSRPTPARATAIRADSAGDVRTEAAARRLRAASQPELTLTRRAPVTGHAVQASAEPPLSLQAAATRADARVWPVPGIAGPEIEQLADRVIGSIDRRLFAQRERLGRI